MDPETLLRYAAGELPADEAAAIARWAAEDEANAAELAVVSAAFGAALRAHEGAAPRPRWDRVAARISADAPPVEPPAAAHGGRATLWLLRAAAIVLLIAGATVFAIYRTADTQQQVLQAVHATAPGETQVVVLPDGSTATLGPASELRVAAGFGRGTRGVQLRGTAFFSVLRDARTPFVVTSDGVQTTVLGTDFVVRAYAGEPGVEVAVLEGRVAVTVADAAGAGDGRPQAAGAELGAGDRAHVEAGVVRIDRDDGVSLLAWRERRLHFRDAPLSEVARELERWYDVEVEVPAGLAEQRRLTTSMTAAELPEVLALLEAALGLRIDYDGTRVVIREEVR